MTLVHVDELPIILNLYGRLKAVPRGSPLLLDIDWVEARVRPSQRKRLLGPRGGGLLVRDALLAAGILKPPNLREVLGVVADCISEAPPGKPLPCVLCLDTNVFYNMFLTLLEEELGRLPRLVASSCISRELAGRLEAYILKQPPRKPKPRPPPDIEEKIDEALHLLHEGRLRQAAAALLRPAERLGMGKKAYKLLEEPTASAVAGLIKALREKLADTQHGTGKSHSPRRGEHPPGRR